MSVRRSRPAGAVALLLVAAAPVAAQDIERVPVRASADGEHARLVFDWPRAVDFETRLAGDTLEVRFARRLIPSFAEVLAKLPAFVESAGLGGGGRVVTFALTGAFDVASERDGNAVIIDLARADAPQPDLLTVPARFGEHGSFSRVVFAWPGEVGYRLERANGRVAVRFDRPAALDLPKRGLPPLIESIDATGDDAGLTVAMAIAERARLRDHRVGNRVVVDVYAPEPEPKPMAAEEPEPEPVAATEAPAPEPTVAAVEQGGGYERPPTAWAAARVLEPAAPAADESEETAAAAPEPTPVRRHTMRRWQRRPPVTVAARAEAAADEGLLVSFDTVANGIELHFGWSVAPAAAAFVRAGHLWVLFDRPATFNFRMFRDDVPVVESAEQVAVVGAAAARFRLSGRYQPTVRREGARWIVRLGPSGGPSEPLAVVAEPDGEAGTKLLVLAEETGRAFSLVDPEVGDRLFVVPVAAPGRGIAPGRRLVDLEMPATAQGVVVRPIADTIAVDSTRGGVEVTGRAGLHLAEVPGEGDDEPAPEPLTPPSVLGEAIEDADAAVPEALATALFAADDAPVFDFAAWSGLGDGFAARKFRFNLDLAWCAPEERADARLALARFRFAHGHAAEALGWIEHAVAEEPWLDHDPTLHALRGGANLLQGRFGEARTDLFDPEFDLSREIRLWRGVWLAENGDMAAAHQAFLVIGPVPEDYPPALRRRFTLLAAEAAPRAGDVERAHAALDELSLHRLGRKARDAIAYVRAVAFAKAGRVDEAFEAFASAAGSDNRLIRAKAERDRIELRLAEGLADAAEAIDGYDRLRFVWRGDAFELDLLQRMAELTIAAGDYGKGLTIYRQAIGVFPDSPDVRVIAKIMNDTYKDLFLGDAAANLSSLEALAIYFDFRELTPVGAIGDRMIYRLADRLVEVDLLAEAASVLQHQVDHRLGGDELARVGARLAENYLLDRKAEAAVRALRASTVEGLPDGLAHRRRELMVRALTEIGEHDQALDLLQGDTAPDADRLRTAVYWHAKDWPAAATVTARMLARWPSDEALDAGERAELMRMAVALALANNRPALARLRERYGGLLESSERAQAFRTIASYVDAGPVDPRALAEAAAEIDSYDAFLASLRRDVATEGLAAAE